MGVLGMPRLGRGLGNVARKLALAATLAMAGTAPGLAWVKAPSQILVTNDRGGPVEDRMRQIETMRNRGLGVAIPYGQCLSACTLYLGLPETCVGRAAVFGFHGPAAKTRGLGLPLDDFERVSYAMASYYPEPVRSWYLSVGRYVIDSYYPVSGAQLIAMGFRECA